MNYPKMDKFGKISWKRNLELYFQDWKEVNILRVINGNCILSEKPVIKKAPR